MANMVDTYHFLTYRSRKEQDITNEALETGKYDNLSDEEWCKLLREHSKRLPVATLPPDKVDHVNWNRCQYLYERMGWNVRKLSHAYRIPQEMLWEVIRENGWKWGRFDLEGE